MDAVLVFSMQKYFESEDRKKKDYFINSKNLTLQSKAYNQLNTWRYMLA